MPTATYQLADHLLDGQLESRLREWRTAGVSFAEMNYLLRKEAPGAPRVTAETLRAWCTELGIHHPETATQSPTGDAA